MTARRRLTVLSAAVIAVIVAVLAVLLPAGTASAHAAPAAGTRVGASHPQMILTVGISRVVFPGEGRCEGLPRAGFASGLCVAAEEIPSAQSLASDVADSTGGTLKELKSGYSVTVPQGSRGIVVRVMEEGGGRTNYYRVSVPGKQAFTVSGDVSTDPALTHIPIGSTSLQDILRIIAGIGQ